MSYQVGKFYKRPPESNYLRISLKELSLNLKNCCSGGGGGLRRHIEGACVAR